MPENVNYAVKSTFLLGFLESAPKVADKLKKENTRTRKFDEVIQSVEGVSALVKPSINFPTETRSGSLN